MILSGLTLEEAVIALGYSLLHFLWQGAVIGVLCAVLLRALREAAPTTRYAVAVSGLVSMALAPMITWFYMVSRTGAVAVSVEPVPTAWAPMVLSDAMTTLQGVSGAGAGGIAAVMPWVVCAWLAGVVVMSLRLWSDARFLADLRAGADYQVPPGWQARMDDFCTRLGIPLRRVGLAVSSRIGSPFVVGGLRPVILFPAALVSRMPMAQLEMILAHELAHIRRYDHLVNLFQVTLETLLFYHPAVRWLSGRLRVEREHCADDLALDLVGDRLQYARTLAELEHFRSEILAFGVGAAHGDLRHRIHRILNNRLAGQKGLVGMLMASFLGLASMLLASAVFWSDGMTTDTDAVSAEAESVRAEPVSLDVPEPVAPTRSGSLSGGTPAEMARTGLAATDSVGDTAPVMPAPAAGEISTPAGDAAIDAPAGNPESPPPVADRRTPETAEDTATTVATPAVEPAGRPAAATARPPAIERERETGRSDTTQARVASDDPAPEASRDGESARGTGNATPQALQSTGRGSISEGVEVAMITPAERPEPAREPVITGGELVHMVPPIYPRAARRRAVEGEVRLAFTITPRGRVTDIEVLDADYPRYRLDRAAREAVSRWRYEPFRSDGEPIARRVTQTLAFNLQGEPNEDVCGTETGFRVDQC